MLRWVGTREIGAKFPEVAGSPNTAFTVTTSRSGDRRDDSLLADSLRVIAGRIARGSTFVHVCGIASVEFQARLLAAPSAEESSSTSSASTQSSSVSTTSPTIDLHPGHSEEAASHRASRPAARLLLWRNVAALRRLQTKRRRLKSAAASTVRLVCNCVHLDRLMEESLEFATATTGASLLAERCLGYELLAEQQQPLLSTSVVVVCCCCCCCFTAAEASGRPAPFDTQSAPAAAPLLSRLRSSWRPRRSATAASGCWKTPLVASPPAPALVAR